MPDRYEFDCYEQSEEELTQEECDALLYENEPDKYEWLNSSLYGGALGKRNQECA